MLRNFLLVAIRNLRKNRLYSILNILGLAVGLAAGILILLYIADEFNYNHFHKNLSSIHLILQNQTQGGVTYTFESTPGPLAAALRQEIPEIEAVARCSWNGRHLLFADNKSFYERGFYAEPDYFKVLQFEAVQGDPMEALKDAGSIVITERTARKFFGDENPIGKTLRHNNERDLRVAAVLRDLPLNGNTLRFDVVLPFRVFEQMNTEWVNSAWGDNSLPTWVALRPGTDLANLNGKLENFIQQKNPEASAHIFAYPFADWRLKNKFENGKQQGGRITLVYLLSIIGVFVLLIACINFMNLATARSERRAREVGVRKAIGAQRSLIIGQFLSEAMLMSGLALILGIGLAQLALPGFNTFFEKSLSLSLSNWPLWSAILALGLITGLMAGSYPALFLSRYQPAKVLKAGLGSGKSSSLLRRSLVAFQFLISILLIITTIVIYRQIKHGQDRPMGYEQDNLIEIPARGDMPGKFELVKQELTQLPGVKSVSAGTDDLIQFGSNTSGIQWPGRTEDQDFLVTVSWVRHDWVKTAGLKMVEGRDFDRQFGADSMSCLVNETAIKQMGLKQPVIGTVLRHDTSYTIVGVIKDFIYNDPFGTPRPMVVYLGGNDMNHFFVRLENNNQWRQTLAQIETAVKKHNPTHPFEFRFVKEEYQRNFNEMRSVAQLASLFGGLAIFISCLGLFGLSAFVAERRQKEIGIRKVLGASVGAVWFQLAKDFLKPVLVAFAMAIPLAIYAMDKLLSSLTYRVELSWWIFAAAGILAVLIALVTVSFQGIRAALINPVSSLRSE